MCIRDRLISFDPQNEKINRYIHDPKDEKSLGDNDTYSVLEDHNMNLWIGTFAGLNKMDRKTGEFMHYKDDTRNTNTLTRNMFSSLLEDSKNRFWAGTFAGINLLDTHTGKSKNYLRGTS